MRKNVAKTIVLFCIFLVISACGGAPKKDDVSVSLSKIMPINFEVVTIAPVSGISGLYEVQVKADKQPLVLYVSKNAKLVVSGSIVDVENKRNLTLETQKKMTVQ